jgi:hypothetical protein
MYVVLCVLYNGGENDRGIDTGIDLGLGLHRRNGR